MSIRQDAPSQRVHLCTGAFCRMRFAGCFLPDTLCRISRHKTARYPHYADSRLFFLLPTVAFPFIHDCFSFYPRQSFLLSTPRHCLRFPPRSAVELHLQSVQLSDQIPVFIRYNRFFRIIDIRILTLHLRILLFQVDPAFHHIFNRGGMVIFFIDL